MTRHDDASPDQVLWSLFPGSDEASAAARAHDWAATPLGPPCEWSPELCAAIRTVMPSRVPMLVWWGPQLIQIFNEAYRPFLGAKREAMGQAAADCWAEIWHVTGPMAQRVWTDRMADFSEDLPLFLERHGYVEETYWTFSYSPITSSAGSVLGIFVATREVTTEHIDAYRLESVRELATLPSADLPSTEAGARRVLDVLSRNRRAVPFAALYLAGGEGGLVRVHQYGLHSSAALPERLPATADHPVATVSSGRAAREASFGAPSLLAQRSPLGSARPTSAYLLPLGTASHPMDGCLVIGLSPYRRVDERYVTFVTLIASQISALLTDVRAVEEERSRREAIAELDRAKTTFFANASHEFRTPLTVIQAASRALRDTRDPGHQEVHLDALERATSRLNRLVDTLLDFARAEAGMLTPVLSPVDLADLTTDIVTMFRGPIESAGLGLEVTIDHVDTVLTDPEAWTKILGNLLANALRFTETGTIRVALGKSGDLLRLAVADTGVGIAPQEVQAVFERFRQSSHRPVRGVPGSGIGLSLIDELSRSLGGKVSLESAPGVGTTVTVEIPVSATPVPAASTNAFPGIVQDLLRDTRSDAGACLAAATAADVDAPRVLLVEDNPDVRTYLTQLLTGDGWAVTGVPDVPAALQVPSAPDVLVCDVMLPGQSGLELARALRVRPEWQLLPIIMLTARTTPEDVAEGLAAGADDYVRKPFEPVELLARVRTHYELARSRSDLVTRAEERAGHLETALSSNRTTGMALGILMARHRLTSEQAFAMLRRASSHLNRKLRDIAEEVIYIGDLPDAAARLTPPGDPASQRVGGPAALPDNARVPRPLTGAP